MTKGSVVANPHPSITGSYEAYRISGPSRFVGKGRPDVGIIWNVPATPTPTRPRPPTSVYPKHDHGVNCSDTSSVLRSPHFNKKCPYKHPFKRAFYLQSQMTLEKCLQSLIECEECVTVSWEVERKRCLGCTTDQLFDDDSFTYQQTFEKHPSCLPEKPSGLPYNLYELNTSTGMISWVATSHTYTPNASDAGLPRRRELAPYKEGLVPIEFELGEGFGQLPVTESITYFVAPASAPVSNWPEIRPGVQGARVMSGSNPSGLAVECTRYDLHGIHELAIPFNPGYGKHDSASFGTGAWKAIQAGSWEGLGRQAPSGPYWLYGTQKKYHPILDGETGKDGVVWQDHVTNKIYFSLVGKYGANSIEVPNSSGDPLDDVPTGVPPIKENDKAYGGKLLVAASNGLMLKSAETTETVHSRLPLEIVYLVASRQGTRNEGVALTAYRVDRTGKVILQKRIPTNGTYPPPSDKLCASKTGGSASIAWSIMKNDTGAITKNQVAVSWSKILIPSHQNGVAFILDPQSLEIMHNFGQYTSHSNDNAVMLGRNGFFTQVHMGDVFPRGIQISHFRITEDQIYNVIPGTKCIRENWTGCNGGGIIGYKDGVQSWQECRDLCKNYTKVSSAGKLENCTHFNADVGAASEGWWLRRCHFCKNGVNNGPTDPGREPNITSVTGPVDDECDLTPPIPGGDKRVVFTAKWGNNNMFADLAHPGVFHTNDDGLIVVFSSERDRVQENMTSHNKYDDPVYLPRNLGVVKVPLNLKNETVMSQEGDGLMQFGNQTEFFSAKELPGVFWLTNETSLSRSNVRVKTARLGKNDNLIIWEVFHNRDGYVETKMMSIDDDGKVVRQEVTLPGAGHNVVRLNHHDDIVRSSRGAVSWHGNLEGDTRRLTRCEIFPVDPSKSPVEKYNHSFKPKEYEAPNIDPSHPTWHNLYQNYDASWATEPSAPEWLRKWECNMDSEAYFWFPPSYCPSNYPYAYGPGDRRLGGKDWFKARGPYEKCCASVDGKIPILPNHTGINDGPRQNRTLGCGGLSIACPKEPQAIRGRAWSPSCWDHKFTDGELPFNQTVVYYPLSQAIATQSSTWNGRAADLAIDINEEDLTNDHGFSQKDTCSHTLEESDPWWQVELPTNVSIKMVRVSNAEGYSGRRFWKFNIFVDNYMCAEDVRPDWGETLDVPCNATGRFVKIVIPGDKQLLNFCDFQLYVDK